MKVKEMIEKLSTVNPEMEVWWDDAIEGNHSEVDYLLVTKWDNNEEVVFVSPLVYRIKSGSDGECIVTDELRDEFKSGRIL